MMRKQVLKYLTPFTIWIGDTHMPFSRKKLDGDDYYAARKLLKPGDILLTKTRGELTNWFIPGDWSHGAMYCGYDGRVHVVVEAVGKGVVKRDLVSFITSKDKLGILRPNFCDFGQMHQAARIACNQVGKPYDYQFDFQKGDQQAFYCIELLYWSYLQAIGTMPFSLKELWGAQTLVPQDLIDYAGQYFDTLMITEGKS